MIISKQSNENCRFCQGNLLKNMRIFAAFCFSTVLRTKRVNFLKIFYTFIIC